jgi:hypothetical protein
VYNYDNDSSKKAGSHPESEFQPDQVRSITSLSFATNHSLFIQSLAFYSITLASVNITRLCLCLCYQTLTLCFFSSLSFLALPDQADPFQIADKIWIRFVTQISDEGRGENSRTMEMYTLHVYTPNRADAGLLLSYHNDSRLCKCSCDIFCCSLLSVHTNVTISNLTIKMRLYHTVVMKEYYDRAKLTLQSKPHIFELLGVNGEDNKVDWDQHEVGLARTYTYPSFALLCFALLT